MSVPAKARNRTKGTTRNAHHQRRKKPRFLGADAGLALPFVEVLGTRCLPRPPAVRVATVPGLYPGGCCGIVIRDRGGLGLDLVKQVDYLAPISRRFAP